MPARRCSSRRSACCWADAPTRERSAPAPSRRASRAWSRWPQLPAVATAVDEAGGEVDDDIVVLARNVSAEGRSRAFVGGAAVPVGTLGSLAESLVAVHGQSDQHRLLAPAAQRDALDRFGGAGLQALLTGYQERLPRPARLRARARRARHRGARARPRGRPAPVRRRRGRGGRRRSPARTSSWRPRSPGSATPTPCAARPSRPARRCRATRRRARRARGGRRGPRAARRRPRPRPRRRRAGRPAGRGELPPQRPGRRRRLLRLRPRRRPGAAGGRLRATGRGHRAHPQVRRDRRRGAGVGRRRRRPGCSTSTPPTSASPSCGADRDRLATELDDAAAALHAARAQAAAGCSSGSPTSSRSSRCRTPGWRSRSPPPSRPPTAPTTSGCCWRPTPGAEPRPLHKGASGGELSRVMLALEVALARPTTSRCPPSSSTRSTPASGERRRSRSDAGWRHWRAPPRCWWSPTCRRSRPTPTATCWCEKSDDGTVTSSGLTRARRRRPRARALPHARGHGRLRHRARPRPRAARGRAWRHGLGSARRLARSALTRGPSRASSTHSQFRTATRALLALQFPCDRMEFREAPGSAAVQARVRHRRRRLLPRQGTHRLQPRPSAALARPARDDAEARPLPQRRPRHHEPVPARRGVRHRRRRGDRPRHRALRAVPRRRPRARSPTSPPGRSTPASSPRSAAATTSATPCR